jgi:hypothetical protein
LTGIATSPNEIVKDAIERAFATIKRIVS